MSDHPAQPHSVPEPGPFVEPERRRRRLARFNRTVTNKITRRAARRLPELGSLTHVGRRTHTVYRTPVSVFRTRDGFRIPLTHGRDADWVQNALNHGAVRLTTRRRIYELTDPVIVHDTDRKYLPRPWRTFLRFFGVSNFIDFRTASAGSPTRH
jgi:deazaflavin-dependent oxidoreductase (nitroreductase family)